MNESTLFPFVVETNKTYVIPRTGINVFWSNNNNNGNNVSDFTLA